MSEQKHTPGPWHLPHFADDDCKCNCRSVVSEYHAGAICVLAFDNDLPIYKGGNGAPPLDEAKANACLIAAAPELLDALKLMVDWYGKRGDESFEAYDRLLPASEQAGEVAKAMEVIAKAEGHAMSPTPSEIGWRQRQGGSE